jgi:hypothetical protein
VSESAVTLVDGLFFSFSGDISSRNDSEWAEWPMPKTVHRPRRWLAGLLAGRMAGDAAARLPHLSSFICILPVRPSRLGSPIFRRRTV